MRLCEIAITESVDIPPTTYGYWITADGECVPVGFQQHGRVLDTILPPTPEDDADLYVDDRAFRRGWVRYGRQHGEIFIRAWTPSRDALVSLIEVVAVAPPDDEVHLEFGPEIDLYRNFDEPSKAVRFLQQMRRGAV